MALEINLVPDIKNEMLKAMKIRNYTFFACIVIAIASVITSLIFWSIAAGQQAVADGKKKTLDTLSSKINSYSDLSDFITIRDQLGGLAVLSENRNVVSRTFDILSAIIPTGADTIQISELNIRLEEGEAVMHIDAQANAGSEPYIDYNVLDSFKKSMKYMRYDYGEYVDKNGETIPAYCIIDKATDGATLYDASKKDGSKYARGYYAYWLIDGDGCRPSLEEEESDSTEGASNSRISANTILDLSQTGLVSEAKLKDYIGDYSTIEEYEGQRVVKIWRTPQYDDWYKEEPVDGKPYMSLDGSISNVPHFTSSCISYTGTESTKPNAKPIWSTSNETCKLVPEGDDGIEIISSSNGKDDESNDLVLRFETEIKFEKGFFIFGNHHMLALSPSGRVNVTDSYVQIQNLFAKRASDCNNEDVECLTNSNETEDR